MKIQFLCFKYKTQTMFIPRLAPFVVVKYNVLKFVLAIELNQYRGLLSVYSLTFTVTIINVEM